MCLFLKFCCRWCSSSWCVFRLSPRPPIAFPRGCIYTVTIQHRTQSHGRHPPRHQQAALPLFRQKEEAAATSARLRLLILNTAMMTLLILQRSGKRSEQWPSVKDPAPPVRLQLAVNCIQWGSVYHAVDAAYNTGLLLVYACYIHEKRLQVRYGMVSIPFCTKGMVFVVFNFSLNCGFANSWPFLLLVDCWSMPKKTNRRFIPVGRKTTVVVKWFTYQTTGR